ncbi:MAG: MlaD family protein [Bacteroidales bacterium]|nr:MlaD family protein [Bacteroidales bacterium]
MNTAESHPWRPSKQAVIGLVGVVTVALFVWFAFFLKGKNLLTDEYGYYAIYEHTHGINVSSPVVLNGYKIGRVSAIDFVSPTDHRIRVEMQILKKYQIPENSIASLESLGLLSGSGVVIHLGDATAVKMPGSAFATHEGADLMAQIAPIKDQLGNILVSVDSILGSVRDVLHPGTVQSLSESFAALETSMKNLAALSGDAKTLLHDKKDDLAVIVSDLKNLSGTLSQNSGKIDHIIDNFAELSDTLVQAQLGQSMQSLGETIQSLENLLKNIENGEGSVGQFLHNDTLYLNIEEASRQLQLLLEDLRLHPSRYVHISLFGKKDKAPAELKADKAEAEKPEKPAKEKATKPRKAAKAKTETK